MNGRERGLTRDPSAANGRWVAAVAGTALAVLVTGCTSAPERAVTVVETVLVPASTSQAGTVPATVIPPPPPLSTTPPSPSATTSATTEQTPSIPSTGSSTKASTTRSSRRSGPATLVQATADPEAAGPDNGPACKADPQYSDEAPTGLRSDVIAGWKALQAKAKAAGIPLCLNDGKRSRAQQQAIYDDYVNQYGTATADELVLTPDKSAHVAGYAVDVQPANGYQWLQASDGEYGFCRIYDNEPWHFEYAKAYISDGCPPRLPKPER